MAVWASAAVATALGILLLG